MSRSKNRGSISALIEDPRELERNRKVHEKRLANVKPSIDNKQPAKFAHIQKNPKKQMQREEAQQGILQSNERLGASIKKLKSFNTRLEPRSLDGRRGSYAERQEARKLERDNRLTMRRIEEVRPFYSAKQMQQEAKELDTIRNRLRRNKETSTQ